MAPNKAAWDKSYGELERRLTGKLFTPELLAKVKAAAKQVRK